MVINKIIFSCASKQILQLEHGVVVIQLQCWLY
jgi:hypothetical protein